MPNSYISIFLILMYLLAKSVNAKLKSYEGYKLFSIFPENNNDLEMINTITQNPNVDVWSSARMIGRPTDILVSPNMQNEFITKLNSKKLTYNITYDNVQRLISQERRHQKNIIPTNYERNYNIEKYYKYSEIHDYLEYLNIQYPNITRIINIGKSFEGRDLNIIHISSEFETTTKPAILIEGGVHAREWISPAQVLYIIHQLVEIDKNKLLIENIDWYLIPTINPDGYDYTFRKDRFWRKTRSKVSSGCIGVDLNRNYGYKWKRSIFCGDSFSGNHNFSESELKLW